MLTLELVVTMGFSVRFTGAEVALQLNPLVTVTVKGLLAAVAMIDGVAAPVDHEYELKAVVVDKVGGVLAQ
jgi:hypothetical protein